MQLTLLTWNGHNIQDTTYASWIPLGQMVNLSGSPIYVQRAGGEYPDLSGSVLPDHSYTIYVKIQPGKSIPTYRDTLKYWFSVNDQTPHDLVAKDVLDSDRQWKLTGIPVRVVEEMVGVYAITLAVKTPQWAVVSSSSSTWSITASGDTKTLTVLGNQLVQPTFTITPTADRVGGWLLKRWIPVYTENQSDIRSDGLFLLANLDTAALVGAGKMLASGDDLIVQVDGSPVYRWLDGMNTASTNVWVGESFRSEMGVLGANIAGAGAVTTITLDNSSDSYSAVAGIYTNKIVLIGSEAFSFTGTVAVFGNNHQFTGCTRAQKGTSMAAHTAGDPVYVLYQDVWMLYSNAAAPAWTNPTSSTPLLDLGVSTNTNWTFSTYSNPYLPRSVGAFTPQTYRNYTTNTDITTYYTATENTNTLWPTVMGAVFGMNTTALTTKSGTVLWTIYDRNGFVDATYSGKKYVDSLGGYVATTWPAHTGVDVSNDGNTWIVMTTEAKPLVLATWALHGPTTVTFGATYKHVRFITSGYAENAAIEFSAVTLTRDVNVVPVAVLGAEIANYSIDAKITNTTTGEYIQISFPVVKNATLTINCQNKTVTYEDGTNAVYALTTSTNRTTWLTLQPGANIIKYEDTGIGTITSVWTWVDGTL